MTSYRYQPGNQPVLMSIPHVATEIPADIAARMTVAGKAVPDTDWHLERLYDFAAELGIGVLQAVYSRYVIDLNRAPDGKPLYPGTSNTELVPTSTFASHNIYVQGEAPDDNEIAERCATHWLPYHDCLARELSALKGKHGIAVLFDCHSIRSHVPRFFEGKLPDFNLGTASNSSCASELRDRLSATLAGHGDYTLAVDGRFKGGYITRHYGQPQEGIHAFQLELSLATYMNEDPPFDYEAALAAKVRPALRAMLEAALDWASSKSVR
ncbi:MAG: N-formylglutamate deformylase [Gammaproteobacteria bacterium]